MTTDFGKFLRKLRVDYDECGKDMADKLEVTASYLSAIEKGKRAIPSDWAGEIARLYELTSEQMKELAAMVIIDGLSDKERATVSEAYNTYRFTDSSDYLGGLWNVVKAIVGHDIVNNDGFNVNDWFDLLNKEE